MSEPLLTVDVEHRAGSLRLQASFALLAAKTALFGPSGVGKTTLLRILAGLVRPQRGTITMAGRILTDTGSAVHIPPGTARGIGMATQSPALFPHLTVEENLRFGLHGMSRDAQNERVAEMIALLELGLLATRRPAALSGGERQRAALARALAPRPRVLLLDEPFSALDAARKSALWAALSEYLAHRHIATLLVSHDAAEVWASAESVIRMEGGIAATQGTPQAMLAAERAGVLRQFGSPSADEQDMHHLHKA